VWKVIVAKNSPSRRTLVGHVFHVMSSPGIDASVALPIGDKMSVLGEASEIFMNKLMCGPQTLPGRQKVSLEKKKEKSTAWCSPSGN